MVAEGEVATVVAEDEVGMGVVAIAVAAAVARAEEAGAIASRVRMQKGPT